MTATGGNTEATRTYLTVDNETKFIYDENSKLIVSDLQQTPYAHILYGEHPYFALRENNGQYYTIYSLQEGEICYMLLKYSPYTGVALITGKTVVYPFASKEDKEILDFLLDIDMPEKLLPIDID
ncbi:hypothetical protein LJC33_01865 [Eubacteriales bacterium OttesenSCG-928-N13]|nr:hypothetical protein [Eubacteriales bacterium OttesenSCG-928-N13]